MSYVISDFDTSTQMWNVRTDEGVFDSKAAAEEAAARLAAERASIAAHLMRARDVDKHDAEVFEYEMTRVAAGANLLPSMRAPKPVASIEKYLSKERAKNHARFVKVIPMSQAR